MNIFIMKNNDELSGIDLIEKLNLTENPTYGSIVKLIGADKANALSRSFGGRRFYIASEPKEKGNVVAIIGIEAAEKLALAWGGQTYAVKMPPSEKRLKIIGLLKENKYSCGEIAGLADCTERYVFLIKAEEFPCDNSHSDEPCHTKP